jgi:hypothetical protein
VPKNNAEHDVIFDSGGWGSRRVEYGRTYIVRPKGRHQATIVWLHGLGDNGARYYIVASLIYSHCASSFQTLLVYSCSLKHGTFYLLRVPEKKRAMLSSANAKE